MTPTWKHAHDTHLLKHTPDVNLETYITPAWKHAPDVNLETRRLHPPGNTRMTLSY